MQHRELCSVLRNTVKEESEKEEILVYAYILVYKMLVHL